MQQVVVLAPPRRLTSLAAFAGHVCRSSPDMELTALLQYLVNQLRARESHDMVVLKELISTMTARSRVCSLAVAFTDWPLPVVSKD